MCSSFHYFFAKSLILTCNLCFFLLLALNFPKSCVVQIYCDVNWLFIHPAWDVLGFLTLEVSVFHYFCKFVAVSSWYCFCPCSLYFTFWGSGLMYVTFSFSPSWFSCSCLYFLSSYSLCCILSNVTTIHFTDFLFHCNTYQLIPPNSGLVLLWLFFRY